MTVTALDTRRREKIGGSEALRASLAGRAWRQRQKTART